MNWALGMIAIVLLVVGLVGQAFEMRRIRKAEYVDDMGAPNIFTRRENLKWYAVIGTGIVLWYVSERSPA